MNTLSINSPQPSFKGVRIYPDAAALRRKASSLIFQIVPDSEFRGIQMGNEVFRSEFADTMTKLFADDEFKKRLWLNPFTAKFRALINEVIEEASLELRDVKFLLEFIKDKKMTVEATSRPDNFRITFHENCQPISLKQEKDAKEKTYSFKDLEIFGYSNERQFSTSA